MRPRDVLAQHLDLTELLGNGQTPLGSYFDSVATMDKVIAGGSKVAPTIARNLTNSRAYLVTAQMLGPLNARAEAMHELTKVGEDISPPRQCGFVVLEDPIVYTELRGRKTIVHALSWGPVADRQGQPGWLVVAYNDMTRQPDDIALLGDYPEGRRLMGRWNGIGTYWLPRGLRIGPPVLQPSQEDVERVEGEGDRAYPTRNVVRAYVALWGLLDETICTHTNERGDRAIMRLAARRKLPTEVTVITLRREAQPVQHPGSGRPLEERVWVDGFRRSYWCGSGPERHREWRNINGHWRGPEDGPVSNRPKVNRLSR